MNVVNYNNISFKGKVCSGDDIPERAKPKVIEGYPPPPERPKPRFVSESGKEYTEKDKAKVLAAIQNNDAYVRKMKSNNVDVGFFDNTSYLYHKEYGLFDIKAKIPFETLNHFVKRVLKYVLRNEEKLDRKAEKYYKDTHVL
ncbi:MAG: hypothetical protein AB1782_12375 [Cyanobacteriota bacterium]